MPCPRSRDWRRALKIYGRESLKSVDRIVVPDELVGDSIKVRIFRHISFRELFSCFGVEVGYLRIVLVAVSKKGSAIPSSSSQSTDSVSKLKISGPRSK